MTERQRLLQSYLNGEINNIEIIESLVKQREEKEKLEKSFDDLDSAYVDLKMENERLRKALEEMADPLAWETRDEALNMAKQALEGLE